MIALYVLVVLLIGLYAWKKNNGIDEQYLVCGRSQGWFSGGLSIGATWIWAPALFISAQQAYVHGLVGFFWFFVPNVLTIIFFGYLASKFIDKFPKGYTLPQYMDTVYGSKVHHLYLFQFTLLQIMAMAVQLLAGSAVISLITGWTFGYIVIFLAVIALIYSSLGGLRASIITDSIQMIFMIIAGVISVFIVISSMESGAIAKGLGGISGDGANIFSMKFIEVMLMTGVTTTIGLFAGPIGDQMFWQRAFAVKRTGMKKAFIVGAISFGIIPLLFGLIGFAGAGSGFVAEDAQMVNIEIISAYAPALITALVTMLIIAGLGSSMDSGYCAIASLAEVDYPKIFKRIDRYKLRNISLLLLAVFASLIAMIPELKIFHLFLFYGTVRAITFIPTLVTILSNKIPNTRYVEKGLMLSLFVGVPIYISGSIIGAWYLNLAGVLLTIGLSGIYSIKGIRKGSV
jgi:Na+/proline symporter